MREKQISTNSTIFCQNKEKIHTEKIDSREKKERLQSNSSLLRSQVISEMIDTQLRSAK